MHRPLISLSALAIAALAASPANAQSPRDELLVQCLGIENDAARLACFDEVARSTSDADNMPPPGSAGTAQTSEVETQTRRFGLPRPNFPSFPGFGGGSREPSEGALVADALENQPNTEILERGDDGDIILISMSIHEVTEFGYGTQRFHMANGQVWEAVGGQSVRVPQRVPLEAEIRRGLVGGYTMKLNGNGRSIRVRRIDY